ncbi:MAG TPA: four helix bundle protein [Thermoanaerobaculia bacterium]|nr:four helix bundle protein [Thermoanaerobaculia bacterium]
MTGRRRDPGAPIVVSAYDLCAALYEHVNRFPRAQRTLIGRLILDEALRMMAALTLANRLADKREALEEASGRLDALRIAWAARRATQEPAVEGAWNTSRRNRAPHPARRNDKRRSANGESVLLEDVLDVGEGARSRVRDAGGCRFGSLERVVVAPPHGVLRVAVTCEPASRARVDRHVAAIGLGCLPFEHRDAIDQGAQAGADRVA